MNKITCPKCWGKNPRCTKCDGKYLIDDTKLSKNFTLGELSYSMTARKKGIPNDLTIKQVDRMGEFVQKLLQPVRDDLGLIEVTSGFRSPELNSVIGGAKESAHMLAYASDNHFKEVSFLQVMQFFKKQDKLKFDQVILEYGSRDEDQNDDWVHIGYKNAAGEQRRQLLVMRNGTYSPWVG
jgi:zinc D-Ala-D-Ala carboxypeptidase